MKIRLCEVMAVGLIVSAIGYGQALPTGPLAPKTTVYSNPLQIGTNTYTPAALPLARSAASTAVSVNTGTSTWTPLYRSVSVLVATNDTTNATMMVICTNMPAVTAVISVAPNTVYGFSATTAGVVTNTGTVLQLQ